MSNMVDRKITQVKGGTKGQEEVKLYLLFTRKARKSPIETPMAEDLI